MKWVWIIICIYILLGIVVNAVELIRGKRYHRDEYNDFWRDMSDFNFGEQVFMWILYIINWPFLISNIFEK